MADAPLTDSHEPSARASSAVSGSPILIVPYMWIGDYVRCHSVVQLINARAPERPVDMLATPLTLPLIDYMPGVRKGVLSDLPRSRLAFAKQWELAKRLRAERYGTALVMPRTWKSALAPFLAGIPERTGFVGEGRLILLNDTRWGERKLERMIDRKIVLALPKGATPPTSYPLPNLVVPSGEVAAWRARRGLADNPVVAIGPATVGPGRRWPLERYAELARRLIADGVAVWVLGGTSERMLAGELVTTVGAGLRDLTGVDLRDAILALAAANAAVASDSGLLHVAAAMGTPSVGIFGPTRPHLTGPLNPVLAVEPTTAICPTCGQRDCPVLEHRRTDDIPVEAVLEAVRRALAMTRRPAG